MPQVCKAGDACGHCSHEDHRPCRSCTAMPGLLTIEELPQMTGSPTQAGKSSRRRLFGAMSPAAPQVFTCHKTATRARSVPKPRRDCLARRGLSLAAVLDSWDPSGPLLSRTGSLAAGASGLIRDSLRPCPAAEREGMEDRTRLRRHVVHCAALPSIKL